MSGEETINTALKFLEHVYRMDSPFNGTVRFDISDSSASSYTKYVSVTTGHGVQVHSTYDSPADCNVQVDRVVLLAILTGTLDPVVALMWGQISLDNSAVMSGFARAFDISPEKFMDFQLSLIEEGAQPDEADMIPPVPLLPQVNNCPQKTPEKLPMKQALAIQTLHLLASCNDIRKDIDHFIAKVKERDEVKKAFDNLDARLEEFQATPTYKNLQSNSVFVTIRTEIERASIGATIVGNKAKDVGEELVSKIASVAYPQTITYQPSNNLAGAVPMNAIEGGGSVDPDAVSIEFVTDKKEQKRLQLLEKLEKLKQYNKQMSEERAQRLASKR